MRIRLRFIFFFIRVFMASFFFTGIFVVLAMDKVFPLLGDVFWQHPNLFMMSALIMPFIISGVALALYFIGPVLRTMTIVRKLSEKERDLSPIWQKINNRKGKPRRKYYLYREMLGDLQSLAGALEETDRERKRLEESKRNWITGVSHDLKTPLTYITGYSTLLLSEDHEFDAEQQRKFLQEINEKSVAITEMIEDLNLSFKLEEYEGQVPIDKTDFDAVSFVQNLTADLVNDPRAEDYDIGFDGPQESIIIHADRKLLSRALRNLLGNAVQHNPPGTEITTGVLKEDSCVVFRVADNGTGMSEEAQRNLFLRYQQDPLSREGNLSGGLGMVVVRNIVDAHGGTLSVNSREGQTEFMIRIGISN